MKLNNYPIGVLLVLDYVAISQSAYLDIFTILLSVRVKNRYVKLYWDFLAE